MIFGVIEIITVHYGTVKERKYRNLRVQRSQQSFGDRGMEYKVCPESNETDSRKFV